MAAALVASGCGGDGRSAEAFCEELADGTEELRASAERTNEITEQNAFAGLLSAFGSLGDFAQLLGRLEERAPDEIAEDMEVVADDFDSVIAESGGAAADLVGGDVSGLAALTFRQLSHANSYRRVDEFALEHCGTQIFGSAPR